MHTSQHVKKLESLKVTNPYEDEGNDLVKDSPIKDAPRHLNKNYTCESGKSLIELFK
jgi:hypothetical protein